MSKQSIAEIKAALQTITDLADPQVAVWREDPRKGVQAALVQREKQLAKLAAAQAAFERRFLYERQLWQAGHQFVAGIDEVGRGPLAGPVVTCAVILNADFDLLGVTDSKQLTKKEREELYLHIVDEAVEVNLAVNPAQRIDEINIYRATQEAMVQAVAGLQHQPSHLIVDAVPLPIKLPQTTLIKGDQKSISIAAASIVAKEYRDHLMMQYAQLYPGYDFDQNMGYGTQAHLAGLRAHGVTPIHRRTFNPVPKFL